MTERLLPSAANRSENKNETFDIKLIPINRNKNYSSETESESEEESLSESGSEDDGSVKTLRITEDGPIGNQDRYKFLL